MFKTIITINNHLSTTLITIKPNSKQRKKDIDNNQFPCIIYPYTERNTHMKADNAGPSTKLVNSPIGIIDKIILDNNQNIGIIDTWI